MNLQEHTLRKRIAQSLGCFGCLGLVCLAVGCGSGAQSTAENLKRVQEQNPNIKLTDNVPFTGKITIDGQAPGTGDGSERRLIMCLVPDTNPKPAGKGAGYMGIIDEQGNFTFTTAVHGDGVPAGKYVVTFALLKVSQKGLDDDQLKNLYNDPDTSEFKVELPPAKSGVVYDLKVADKEPAKPGPRALTHVEPMKIQIFQQN